MGPENTEPRGTYQPDRLMASKPLKLNNVSRYRIGNAQAPDHDAATIFLKAASGVIFLRSNEPPEPRLRSAPQGLAKYPVTVPGRTEEFDVYALAVFIKLQDNGRTATEIAFGIKQHFAVQTAKGVKDVVMMLPPEQVRSLRRSHQAARK